MSPTTLDETVLRWVVTNRCEPWLTLAHAVTTTGNTVPMMVATILVVIGLVIRRHRSDAVVVGVGALLGYLLMVLLKQSFQRPRPPGEYRLVNVDTYSFPSGHAMMSMIVFGMFAVAAYRRSAWVRAHRWIVAAAPLWSIAAGMSRIYLAVHWTTDVIAGWLLGAAWVGLCVLASTWFESSARRLVHTKDRRSP